MAVKVFVRNVNLCLDELYILSCYLQTCLQCNANLQWNFILNKEIFWHKTIWDEKSYTSGFYFALHWLYILLIQCILLSQTSKQSQKIDHHLCHQSLLNSSLVGIHPVPTILKYISKQSCMLVGWVACSDMRHFACYLQSMFKLQHLKTCWEEIFSHLR